MLNGFQKGRKDMAEKIFKFKIVPQQERFYNENSNWGVYTFTTTSDDIPYFYDCYDDPFGDKPRLLKGSTLAGKMQRLTIGVEYNAEVTCSFNSKYNSYQYTPISITANVPKTEEQQIAYLKTQVTELQAKNILAVYPNIIDDVIHNREIDFMKIKGIGERSWNRIKDNILNNYVISDILIMLQPLGVTYAMISKLISNEPNPQLLKEKLLDNPYIMTEIRGLGFKRVDDLALKLNPDIRISTKRVVAFIKYYLESVGNNDGHSYVLESVLDNAVRDNINDCYEIYENFKSTQKQHEIFLHFEENKVGLLRQYKTEISILDILKNLNEQETDYKINIENGISEAEREQGFCYTDEQKQEIYKACNSPVVLITGRAGTGKSSILRGLTKIYKRYSISACALSAKAAIRITEATGLFASTIHRLLGFNKIGFVYNSDNRLPSDIIVLDEASMVNSSLFYSLVSAIKEGAKVIIVGDDGQLPPIGCGNIFHDLLNCNVFTCCKLTKILRQAQKSGIISDSVKIRNGENPLPKPKLKVVTGELQDMTYMFRESREGMRELAIKLYTMAAQKDGYDETIILTPCKKDRINSSFEINSILQDMIIPPDTAPEIRYGNKIFRVGAKVIQRTNDYDRNVFNGEMGYITKIEQTVKDGKKQNVVTIKFADKKIDFLQNDLSSIELAYCLTCHLTQGSGFKNVIVLIDNTHYKLLDRCMLYTAITRAKTKCALIAEPSAFQRCLKIQASQRNTWLSLLYNNI